MQGKRNLSSHSVYKNTDDCVRRSFRSTMSASDVCERLLALTTWIEKEKESVIDPIESFRHTFTNAQKIIETIVFIALPLFCMN